MALLAVTLIAVCGCQNQAPSPTTGGNDPNVSDDFFHDPRMSAALTDLMKAVMDRCDNVSGQPRVCLSRSTISAMPNAPEMVPYCQGLNEFIDEYFCLVMGASAIDLVAQSGVDDKLTFIREHGPEGEHAINTAGAEVIKFLAKKCPEGGDDSGCGPREAANRLRSDPKDVAACKTLQAEWGQVTCLITSHVVSILRTARMKA
jgi:hypothetical protein